MKLLNTADKRVFGERITVPEFEIVSNPTIHIADVKRMRFDIINCAVSAHEIAKMEGGKCVSREVAHRTWRHVGQLC